MDTIGALKQVTMFKDVADPVLHIVAKAAEEVTIPAGETIGEAQFIDGEPAGGTVTALERVDLLVIRSEKLTDALAGHPEAGYELYRAIARSLAGRLRRAVSMLAFARERGVAR